MAVKQKGNTWCCEKNKVYKIQMETYKTDI